MNARRVVLISGAGGGLGTALCRSYIARGDCVVALEPDAANATALERSLPAKQLLVCSGALGDVTNAESCRQAVAAAVERFGRIDIVINNAGITQRSLFVEADLAQLRRVMEVNYLGAVHLTHAALPQLVQHRGVVAAVSSVAGFAPLLGRSAYCASKHALHGFFDTLRCELAPQGVAVCLASPSFIATAIARSGETARVATGGESSPDQIAAAILQSIDRREPQLLPDRTSRMAWWVSKLAPRFYARTMTRRIAPEYPSFIPKEGA
ncbi:SDR family oxidoreductase [Curvibacter sp. APW13]|uniref:SDR family oxidoreductase n=1 Tax=Curvibacter sp. APW13 TaxID=3077236 RepID=UPI0028DE0A46|nr:SDR family oxidoreductase [Curvibacter sp. APW13]MDT8989449.1 SDR family oxidoreductase [Curvibacter sp. APW13]